jgi:hypothetical protein
VNDLPSSERKVRKAIPVRGQEGQPVCGEDMMLYTYFDERKTVLYWRTVAFNIIAMMVLNSCILYKGNYRRPDKLKTGYNYTVSIIESGGGVVGAEGQSWSR